MLSFIPIRAKEITSDLPGEKRVFPSITADFIPSEETSGTYVSKLLTGPVPDSIIEKTEHILGLTGYIQSSGRFISKFDELTEIFYPVGISTSTGLTDVVVALESDEITPEGAFLKAVMCFSTPDGKQLAFESKRFLLSPGGGILGDVELALVNSETIELGEHMSLVIHGQTTFATIDCHGFKQISLDAELVLSPEKFVPENPVTGEIMPGTVSTAIHTTIKSWNDLLVTVNLPPFQIKGFKDVGFEIQDAVFDMSDYGNPAGVYFPADYPGIAMFAGSENLWRGIFIREINVRLPAKLNNGHRIILSGNNMLIDHLGFTGNLSAENLIPDGSLGGWAYSLDQLQLGFLAGQLTYGGINGYLSLPVSRNDERIFYEALIDQKGDFHFTAGMPETVGFNMWYATVTIDPASRITIEEINHEFVAGAVLHGTIDINAPLGKEDNSDNTSTDNSSRGFAISGIQFQDLTLSSRAPHFKPGIWSVQSVGVNDLNGFSLVLDNITMIQPNSTEAGISFTARVSLSQKFYAAASLDILGTMGYENSEGEVVRQKWRYKDTRINGIEINNGDGIIKLHGVLSIYRHHVTYGKGAYGIVEADIAGIGVAAMANFGEVDNTRYWFVDALASSKFGLVNLGGMSVYGIGGGAYYHMKQEQADKITFTGSEGVPSLGNIGKALSGISYIPDNSISRGFKATVILGTAGTPRPFNANATFEIVFNSRGGVNNLAFYGSGYFMQDLDLTRTEISAPVYADVFIGMDFENKVLHGNFKVFVNLAGGIIRGINENNLAGEVVMHFDPVDWYIHIGTPSRRVGLVLDIGILKIQNGSYFMVGTQIEPMPPPPERVLSILNMTYKPNRELDELFTGRGFAFGSDFSLGFDASFLVFYASLHAGLGFDVMLADYGEAYCMETNRQLGINGWYAMGQAYAYIEANIGIRVKVFGDKRELEILAIGAATLLEAKLPNPFWMRGTVGGYYRILGGLVKGNCRFQFEVGKQCTVKTTEYETSAVQGLEVISELTPAHGKTGVDVFTNPQAVFNYPVNKPFNIVDEDDNTHSFRIILDRFDVLADGLPLQGTYTWNSQGDVLAFSSHDLLPGETQITIKAGIHFEEKTGSTWKKVTVNNNSVTENKEYVFVTDKPPEYIPEDNIEFCYPLPDMMNFYTGEYNQGYIQLIKGQPYLFKTSAEWSQTGRFSTVTGGNVIFFDIQYDSSNRRVNYALPAGLHRSIVYKLDIVNIPKKKIDQVDINIEEGTQKKDIADGSDVEMQTKSATGSLTVLEEKTIYEAYIRTSKYATLGEKLANVEIPYSLLVNVNNVTNKLRGAFEMDEPFDRYEKNGAYITNPLLRFEASKEGIWLKEFQIPLIYDDYPITFFATITNRDTSGLGLVPVRAVTVDMASLEFRTLTEEEKYSGVAMIQSKRTYINYNLAPYTYNDYHELVSKLANSNATGSRTGYLLTTPYPPVMLYEIYPVKVHYMLPGINQKTSTTIIKQKL